MIGSAPPFELELGKGSLERACAALIWAGAFVVAWVWLHGWVFEALADAPPAAMAVDGVVRLADGLAGLGAAAAGALLGWLIARPLRGRLIWDGQAWALQSPVFAFAAPLPWVSLGLDLGGAVVLRSGSGAWCVVTRGQAGRCWHGLQLALRSQVASARRLSST